LGFVERRREPACRFVRSEPGNDLANAFAESFSGSDPDSLRDPRLISLLSRIGDGAIGPARLVLMSVPKNSSFFVWMGV
jgi:hypothetical protein